jgi:hypothetical protein
MVALGQMAVDSDSKCCCAGLALDVDLVIGKDVLRYEMRIGYRLGVEQDNVKISGEREAILPRISDSACGEKPSPPCALEIRKPKNPCFFKKSQIFLGISRSCRICQSSTSEQSSSVAPSRKAFSSSVSVMGGMARSFCQLGRPPKNSASYQTVPPLNV